MRNLDELNIVERGKPVKRTPPDDAEIASFEAYMGYRLPNEYLRLLNYSNGGHPERNSILPFGKPGAGRWAVNHFYHLNGDKASVSNLWKVTDIWRPVLGQDALPFAADGGGNQFYLDLSVEPAAVKVCLHDDNCRTLDVAPSFEAFIDALEVEPDAV